MAGFSASQAIGSGFRLIARHPLAVLVWAVAYLVIGVLPQFLVMGAMLPDLVSYYQQIAKSALEHTGPPDTAQALAFQAKIMALQPISLLASIVSHTVLLAAVCRAVLMPQDNRFFYLRLGMRELWLGLTLLVLVVLWILMVVALVIPLAIAGVATAAVAEKGGGLGVSMLVVCLIALVGFAAMVWVMLRLSMAPPMSFAQKRFALYESWPLTRGQALPLFGVCLALFVILIVLEVVLFGIMGALLFGGVLGGAGLKALVDATPQSVIHAVLPGFLVFVPIAAVLGVALYVVLFAPFADIYRQLTDGEVVP